MDVVRGAFRGRSGVARFADPSLHSADRPSAAESRIVVPVSPAQSVVAPVALDSVALRSAITRVRRTIDRHAAALTRLDAVLGDGDHGDNLSIGFRAVEEVLAGLPADARPGDVLRAVGHCLISAVGGASGPLYGTAFIEAGFRAGDVTVIDGPLAAAILGAAADGVARRGRCAVGDKTILDTLRPAATALGVSVSAGSDAAGAARATLAAAREGMRSTRPLVARRGIALRLGERSKGHLDPGAVSCFLILRGLAARG
jgi:dihydroxyacetone kinase-like protein